MVSIHCVFNANVLALRLSCTNQVEGEINLPSIRSSFKDLENMILPYICCSNLLKGKLENTDDKKIWLNRVLTNSLDKELRQLRPLERMIDNYLINDAKTDEEGRTTLTKCSDSMLYL